jgi:phosphohistidine phosphatase
MDLILWRHAEAEDGGPDLERRLTREGLEQAARVARWLIERLPPDFEVLASPAARAQQTAGALKRKIATSGRIAPGATVAAILEAAGWPQAEHAVVLVGHQPDLGRAAAHLVAGSGGAWSIRKGGLWWLTRRVLDDESQVVVRAVLSPELLP